MTSENIEGEVVELSEIYRILLEDSLSIAHGLVESVRHFVYFCATLAIFGAIIVALGASFFIVLDNFLAAASSWIMGALIWIYAWILWTDYTKMRRRFSALFAVYDRLKEKVKVA